MSIEVVYADGVTGWYGLVKNYDFYPETKMLFVECAGNEAVYIPVNENVKRIVIRDGAERGYLEGHNEAG